VIKAAESPPFPDCFPGYTVNHPTPVRDREVETSDSQLALRAQEGCANSFERLVRRHQVSLLAYLRLKSRTRQDAEDAVQDAFLRAFEKLELFQPKYSFKVWLFTIARRQMINRLRRREAFAAHNVNVDIPDDQLSPDQKLELLETRDRLWHAAERLLSESQFTTLWLHYGEGLTTKEIGQVLGHSRPRVKTTLFRARRLLKQQLCPEAPTEQDARQEEPTIRVLPTLTAEMKHA